MRVPQIALFAPYLSFNFRIGVKLLNVLLKVRKRSLCIDNVLSVIRDIFTFNQLMYAFGKITLSDLEKLVPYGAKQNSKCCKSLLAIHDAITQLVLSINDHGSNEVLRCLSRNEIVPKIQNIFFFP